MQGKVRDRLKKQQRPRSQLLQIYIRKNKTSDNSTIKMSRADFFAQTERTRSVLLKKTTNKFQVGGPKETCGSADINFPTSLLIETACSLVSSSSWQGLNLTVHPEVSYQFSGSKLDMVIHRWTRMDHVVSILELNVKYDIDTHFD